MYTAGIDLGSTTGKCVIMKDGKEIIGQFIAPSTAPPDKMSVLVMEAALKQAGLSSHKEMDSIITTGYGRLSIEFATENMSEISCHAKGLGADLNPATSAGIYAVESASAPLPAAVIDFVFPGDDRFILHQVLKHHKQWRSLPMFCSGVSSGDDGQLTKKRLGSPISAAFYQC